MTAGTNTGAVASMALRASRRQVNSCDGHSASAVMCRSINAQAEFWMKIGMLAEANPTLPFNDIVKAQLAEADVRLVQPLAA